MTQIAVYIQNNMIENVATEKSALTYSSKKGWTLVESDPAFLISERFNWTVRQSDNKLVHVSTGMTPDEESTKANALLGQNVGKALAQSSTANKAVNGAIESVAALGKLIAPILAAQTKNDGGTK